MNIRIVDDHALFREGGYHLLNALEEQVGVLEASDCERAVGNIDSSKHWIACIIQILKIKYQCKIILKMIWAWVVFFYISPIQINKY